MTDDSSVRPQRPTEAPKPATVSLADATAYLGEELIALVSRRTLQTPAVILDQLKQARLTPDQFARGLGSLLVGMEQRPRFMPQNLAGLLAQAGRGEGDWPTVHPQLLAAERIQAKLAASERRKLDRVLSGAAEQDAVEAIRRRNREQRGGT